MKVFLAGNPNAGKTTLFNLLTRAHAKVGNWHGVTVGALQRRGAFGGGTAEYVDLPGMYTAEGGSMEEKAARAALDKDGGAGMLFVAECASLARVLPLFYELGRGRRAALVLTKKRHFLARGGRVDERALSRRLRVPVFCAEGMGRREAAEHAARILTAAPLSGDAPQLVQACYVPAREGLTRTERLLLHGGVCVPLFLLFLAAAFVLTFAPRFPGDLMKTWVEGFFSDVLGGAAGMLASPVARALLAEGVLPALGTVLGFLPQILMLFFFLTLLEESGFLSRLAAVTDGAFSAVGLSGRAIFSLAMGFGCTAAAILTTRGLDDKRVQRRTILCLPYIACSAKLPVFLTLSASFFSRPFFAVCTLYALGVALSLLVAALTNRGEKQPFVMELAPLQCPRPIFVVRSLLFQAKQFIIKTATVIFAFLLASSLLASFDVRFQLCGVQESMLADICRALSFLFAPAGMKDWRISYAAFSGLIAKENVAGAIQMLCGEFPYGAASAFALNIFVLCCSPCVSAVAAAARELGKRRALAYAALQTASALLLSYLAYFLWNGGLAAALLAAAPAAAWLLIRKKHERVHRNRSRHARRVHRSGVRAGVLLPADAPEGAQRARKRGAGGGGCAPSRGGRGPILHDARPGGKRGVRRRI